MAWPWYLTDVRLALLIVALLGPATGFSGPVFTAATAVAAVGVVAAYAFYVQYVGSTHTFLHHYSAHCMAILPTPPFTHTHTPLHQLRPSGCPVTRRTP